MTRGRFCNKLVMLSTLILDTLEMIQGRFWDEFAMILGCGLGMILVWVGGGVWHETGIDFGLLDDMVYRSQGYSRARRVWEKYKEAGNMVHAQIALLLHSSNELEMILEACKTDIRLPSNLYADLKKHGSQYLVLQTVLCNHFTNIGLPLFTVTAKLHYFSHCLMQAQHLNPRLAWCFSGESLAETVIIQYVFHHRAAPVCCWFGSVTGDR